MREIKQGTLFSYDLVLKVPDNFKESAIINKNTLSRVIKQLLELEKELNK